MRAVYIPGQDRGRQSRERFAWFQGSLPGPRHPRYAQGRGADSRHKSWPPVRGGNFFPIMVHVGGGDNELAFQ